MRRQYHKSSTGSMLGSKRIAVALCAAIAMVLGAMSVGATRHINAPLTEEAGAQGDTSSLLANRSTANDSKPTFTAPLSASYSSQQPLTTTPVVQQAPLLVNLKNPQVDVRLGPVQTLIDKDKIELDLGVPALLPVVPSIDASVTVDPSDVTQPVEGILDNVLPDSQVSTQNDSTKDQSPTEQLTP